MHIESIAHEGKVLANLFLQPDEIAKRRVTVEEFRNPRYQKLFTMLIKLRIEAFPAPDVSDLIREAGRRSDEPINDLLEEDSWALNFHLEQMRLLKKQEDVRSLALKVDALSTDELQEKLLNLTSEIHNSKEELDVDLKEYLAEYHENLKARKNKQSVGLLTGFKKLDDWIAIEPGQLVTLGARPSVGKSALALNMAYGAAQYGAKVCYVTLEMTTNELMNRLYAGISSISSTRFKYGNVEEAVLTKCATEIRNMPGSIEFKYMPGSSTSEILRRAAFTQSQSGLDLLIIDHMDLIQEQGHKNENESTTIGRITSALKSFAGKNNCVVLVLSQLNREAKSGLPEVYHLRGSGAKEQDSDIILLLHRDLDPDADDKGALARIVKNRNGNIGDLPLRYVPELTTFKEF